ncbi:hypothetical protein Rrhod_3606 [Rhodococcus rhodnii LMG 5362]|uniref:Phosphoenolpyruvate guanylyltransferase n=1 Tax=Rhodococcus rhodnii LMG 5362 TaxID=1273125 RepID=R7WIM0_9NOCA|nr:hypothetical protein Rrhod_3606 [Rhodococcus rhodnii LMG 5362]
MHVLMAVKDLAIAKSRLDHAVDPGARAELVVAMFADTLAAATSARGVDDAIVVTPDARIAERARLLGARVIADPAARTDEGPRDGAGPDDGLNRALAAAAHVVRASHPEAMLVALQADLPSLTGAELDDVLRHTGSTPRAFVTDRHGTGTALLIHGDPLRPLAPAFGADSALRHRASGAHALAGAWPGLRTDVDTGDDLRAAVHLGVGPATAETLSLPGVRRHFASSIVGGGESRG